MNGLVFADLAGLVSFVWFGDPEITVVRAFAMLANLLLVGLSGMLVPLVYPGPVLIPRWHQASS